MSRFVDAVIVPAFSLKLARFSGPIGLQWRLPVELYRPIFQHLTSRSDLYKLLFTSRLLLHDVEQCLYRVIVVTDIESSLSLFDRIGAADQARVAAYVRELTLPDVSPYWILVHLALKAMVHLRILTVNGDLSDTRGNICLISDCSFQLRSLTAYGFEPRYESVLKQQTQLEELLLPDIFSEDSDDDEILSPQIDWTAFPNIKVLGGGSDRIIRFLGEARTLKGIEWMTGIPPTDMRIIEETVALKLWVFTSEGNILDLILRPFPFVRHLYCVILPQDVRKFILSHEPLCLKDDIDQYGTPRSHFCADAQPSRSYSSLLHRARKVGAGTLCPDV